MGKSVVHVIVWGSEVELKGLPPEVRQEAEEQGGFWVGTGLRLTAERYHQLRAAHPDLEFAVYPAEKPQSGPMTV